MTQTQQDLLSRLAHTLFGKPASAKLTEELLQEAKAQAVFTLVADGDDSDSALVANIFVLTAHAELTELLRGIPFTTFKGWASASYYPEPMCRAMGDVDFYVSPAFYEQAVQRLTEAGFQPFGKPHERHRVFQKNGIIFELHSEIKGIPNGADGIPASATAEARVRELFADFIDTAVTVTTPQGDVVIPDDLHHGVVMLLHVAGHMLNDGGIGLRHLCDWAAYVHKVDLTSFQSELERIGLWTFARQLTAESTLYLGLPEQPWTGTWDKRFLSQLMEDLLAAGNFGNKETDRIAATDQRTGSLATLTRKRYSRAQKPILLPFYMARDILRYGRKLLRGERKLIKLSALAGAKKRAKLYRQFRLFEI